MENPNRTKFIDAQQLSTEEQLLNENQVETTEWATKQFSAEELGKGPNMLKNNWAKTFI